MKPTERPYRAKKGKPFQNQNGRPNSNSPRPPNNQRPGNSVSNNSPDNQAGRRANAKTATQIWMNAPSQTLTSHLPTVGKRNPNGFSKRNNSQNSQESFSGNNKNRNQRSEQPRNTNPKQRSWNNGKPQKSTVRRDDRPQNSQHRSGTNDRVQTLTNGSSNSSKLNPFDLFCAYHLGIGPDNTYKQTNLNQVAQRFGVDPGVIRQTAKDFGFDPGTMLDKEFDLALAQLDIQVAPDGISKIELAKGIYDEFLNAPELKRDWGKIIEEDKKENAKMFGR